MDGQPEAVVDLDAVQGNVAAISRMISRARGESFRAATTRSIREIRDHRRSVTLLAVGLTQRDGRATRPSDVQAVVSSLAALRHDPPGMMAAQIASNLKALVEVSGP